MNEGGRRLCRCKACGGYVLAQSSEKAFIVGSSIFEEHLPESLGKRRILLCTRIDRRDAEPFPVVDDVPISRDELRIRKDLKQKGELKMENVGAGIPINETIPQQKVHYSLDSFLEFFHGERKKTFPLYYSSRQLEWISQGYDVGEPVGRVELYHDVSMEKWRVSFQLEPDRWWFLSVFFHEEGAFDMFSLDFEDAHDSHYEFEDEEAARRILYQSGDEDLFLHEIMIRFIKENSNGDSYRGGFALKDKIWCLFLRSSHY